MNCKNCEKQISGNFCSHCGQKSSIKKINLSSFLEELSESVFQVNKGFFYTIKMLFLNPGDSIKAFLNGQRKPYFKPITYVLTLSTVYYILSKLLDGKTWMNNFIEGFTNGAKSSSVDNEAIYLFTWLSNNFAYATLISIPIFSLASYLLFIKHKYNYLEHIVINAYIIGQQAILYSLFIVITLFINNPFLEALPFLVSVVYNFWVYWQVFNKGNRLLNVLRTTMVYCVNFILFMIISFIIAFAIIIFIKTTKLG